MVIYLHRDGVSSVSPEVVRAAEHHGLILIALRDDGTRSYYPAIKQVMDRIEVSDGYEDEALSGTAYNLLNFERFDSFEAALRKSAVDNNYQVVVFTKEYSPILSVETRYAVPLNAGIALAKSHDIAFLTSFERIDIGNVITFWGGITIKNDSYILLIVDNDGVYDVSQITKLAKIIELAMGMWKYVPNRNARDELIRAVIRNDLDFSNALLDEAGLSGKHFVSVFYCLGIEKDTLMPVFDKCREKFGVDAIAVPEGAGWYSMLYADKQRDSATFREACLDGFERIKSLGKDIRVMHMSGIETLEEAGDGFSLIIETKDYIEKIFPYKRVFNKYDMTLVSDCVRIHNSVGLLKTLHSHLLTPFSRELSNTKKNVLLDTLETYILDAGMNSAKTAEFMGVHNNTVQYRLKRANEILGTDMMSNRVIPALTVALALRRLEDN